MNALDILMGFASFLGRQPHLKQDFIDAVMASSRDIVRSEDFEWCTVADGISMLLDRQDRMVKQVIFKV